MFDRRPVPDWPPKLPLRLEDVRVSRGGSEVLKGIELTFEPGRRYVLIGPSGSGKSTLLRLLNRLEDPAGGSLFLGGTPLRSFPIREVRRRIGLVFQAPRPLPGTVLENLGYPLSIRGWPVPDPETLSRSLAEFGLNIPLDRDASGLSGGERQRLAMAVILGLEPEILALDEPTSALDPASADRLCDALAARSASTGLRTIAVCHDRSRASKLGDWGVVLESGLIKAEGPIGEILETVDLPDPPELSS